MDQSLKVLTFDKNPRFSESEFFWRLSVPKSKWIRSGGSGNQITFMADISREKLYEYVD